MKKHKWRFCWGWLEPMVITTISDMIAILTIMIKIACCILDDASCFDQKNKMRNRTQQSQKFLA